MQSGESRTEGATLPGVLALTTAVQVLGTAAALSLTGIAPLVAADLGLDAHLVGYQISLLYLVGIAVSVQAGAIIARFGPVHTEAVCLVAFAIGFVAYATGSLPFFVLGAVAIGIGYGLQNPAASHMLNAVTPRTARGFVFSLKQAGVPLGALVASFVLPFAAGWYGWRAGLAVAALVPLGLAAVVWMRAGRLPARAASDRRARAGFVSGQRLILGNGGLRALALLSGLYSAVQLSLSAYVVIALVEGSGWSLVEAGSAAGAMQAAGATGRLSLGALADRIGGGLPLLGGVGLVGAGIAVALSFSLAAGAPPIVLVALLVAAGLSWVGWNGVMLAETARLAPEGRTGEATGAVLAYTYTGSLAGPAGFAFLIQTTGGFTTGFAACAVFGLCGFMLTRMRSAIVAAAGPADGCAATTDTP